MDSVKKPDILLMLAGVVLVLWIYLAYNTMEKLDRCETELFQAKKQLEQLQTKTD